MMVRSNKNIAEFNLRELRHTNETDTIIMRGSEGKDAMLGQRKADSVVFEKHGAEREVRPKESI